MDVEEDEENSDVFSNALRGYYLELRNTSSSTTHARKEPDELLKKAFGNTCLICINSIKKQEAVWSCKSCYELFHLVCIQQWAKDGVSSSTVLSLDIFPGISLQWTCPKCRGEYAKTDLPTVYRCFCGKKIDPTPDPWLLAHSCGAICGRDLKTHCGHKCLSLCHPGPCPPCPKTVHLSCYCGRSSLRAQRCGNTGWSCGSVCNLTLSCGLHTCEHVCHKGLCPPCSERAVQPCLCGRQVKDRPCYQPEWSCGQVCGKPLSCNHHKCQKLCHSNDCGQCPGMEERCCPCGKKKYNMLACTTDPPCCGDTCSKLLECGKHECIRKCHFGSCGPCLQSYEKACRCGQKKKCLPCNQEYICDNKCQRFKQCGRHQCRKKCCPGNCQPCEQLCGRLLSCKNHKCSSPCHSGRCYPCVLSTTVSCACGKTTIEVPCGRQKSTKPPRCSQPCSLPSSCHHHQPSHPCHFGKCPPCKQICSLPLDCGHLCTAVCHSQPVIQPQSAPVAPWKKIEPTFAVIPCPPCTHQVSKTCHGGHEVRQFDCSKVASFSCLRLCGRVLKCGNHTCTLKCHVVINADAISSGENCLTCEEPCMKNRHPECRHACPLPCHLGTCPPCESNLRISCHCSNLAIYIKCRVWCAADTSSRNSIRTCNGPCPKLLPCGHQCPQLCHSGPCDVTECCKRVTVRCPCRRLKKEWKCSEQKMLVCDKECALLLQKQQEALYRATEEIAALKQKEEATAIAQIERQLRPRRKKRKKEASVDNLQKNTSHKLKVMIVIILLFCLTLLILLILYLSNQVAI